MYRQVSAVLLAAGSSQRVGQLKQLLPLKGKPIIRHSLDSLFSSRIKDIVVVLGSHHNDVEAALDGLAVTVVKNEIPGSDMAESVRAGLRAVHTASTGVLISLSDQPLVLVETLNILLNHHSEEPEKILIPRFKAKKGHPVIFPRSLITDIFSSGNLRDITKRYSEKIELIPVMDEGVVLDIDTMEDYRKILIKVGESVEPNLNDHYSDAC